MRQPTPADTTERLARLERGQRRLKRVGVTGLLGVTALLLTAQVSVPRVPTVIEAQRFVVRDARGRQAAILGVDADGSVGLGLFDATGKLRAAFTGAADGKTTLELLDKAGNESALVFARSDGTPGEMLRDGTGQPRVALTIIEGVASIGLRSGPRNEPRFVATAGADAASVGVLDDRGQTRLNLGVSGDTAMLMGFDKTGAVTALWKVP